MFGLGPHVIGWPESLEAFVETARPAIIKYLDPENNWDLPKAPITIGRIHWISEEKDLSDSQSLAIAHAGVVAEKAEMTGITLWEGINEAPIWNGADYIQRLVAYENERLYRLHQAGLNGVVLNLSVGWPEELEDGSIDWEPFSSLLRNLEPGDYLGVHEYWLPSGPLHRNSHLHRAGRLFQCPYNVPILVTECGVDIGGGQNDGWKAQKLTVGQYIYQLTQYRDMLAQDARVKGATVFTYGNTGDWSNFDIEPDWLQFAPVFTPVTIEPEVEDPIRILYQGKVLTMELEEYLRGVVPAEIYAVSWPESSGLGESEPEGLKAQAIAARTYAMWRREHPRNENFDIYADTRDQVWKADVQHPNTDQAITDTSGVYLLDVEDHIFAARYVSRCGREDCTYCKGKNGFGKTVWTGRLCQYGTQYLAQAGLNHRQILISYYGLIKFSLYEEDDDVPEIPTNEITLNKYLRPQDGSRLGLHWTPVPGHAHSDLTPFINDVVCMNIKWVTLLDDGGGSSLQSNPYYDGKSIIEVLTERDIIPIVRFLCAPLARFDARLKDTSERLVHAGVRYILWMNEPETPGEWKEDGEIKIPKDWVQQCTRNFVDGAYQLKAMGAYPGWWATTTFHFPDENGLLVNPFVSYLSDQERLDLFHNGYAWIPIHNYPKNHPLDYPADPVNQYGKQMTEDEYTTKVAEVRQAYRERPEGHLWVFDDYQTNEAHINFVRDRNINEGDDLWDDDVCFRMYQGLNQMLDQAGVLPYTPIISTEAGPVLGQREDGRYAKVTPGEQIRMVSAQLQEACEVENYLGMTFWLGGVARWHAATADGFEDQAWYTHRHDAPFGLNGVIPIVYHLMDTPGIGVPDNTPNEPDPPEEEPSMPNDPELINEAKDYGVIVEPADVPVGITYWKCVRVRHLPEDENNGNHHLYVNVLSADGSRVGPNIAVVNMWWGTTPMDSANIPLTKPDNEPMGNGPLYRGQVVCAQVVDELDSDRVCNIHTGHPDEPPGNTLYHHSFEVTWQLVSKQIDEPDDPPLPDPELKGCSDLIGALTTLIKSWTKS